MHEHHAAAAVRRALRVLGAAVADPGSATGPAAAAVAELLCEVERVASAGKLAFARQAADAGAPQAAGHRDAAAWLAAASGEPVGRARGMLDAVEQLGAAPATRSALAEGRLSMAQAQVLAPAVAADPAAAPALVDVARNGSFRELRQAAGRTRRRARGEVGEVERERRVHARRYCRISEPDAGGVRVDAWLTKIDGARLVARLEAEADAVFRESGGREPRERYRADALTRLSVGTGAAAPAHVVVRVDAAALRRGSVEGGEVCEIAGVGEVPVADARRLLGDAFLTLLVTDGVDVRTVTSTTRTVPRAVRIALAERDPTCVVPGCAAGSHLEIDHWRVDFARGGPTCLDNLARLCGRHHAMKTRDGWRLAGGPGRWRWVGPGP